MADIHETARKKPTEPAGDVLVRGIVRLLARSAARAHFQHSLIEGEEDHEEVDDDVRAAADRG